MGPKKQGFCSKWILWIDIVWGLQKLGLILESKVVQKLSLEKNGFNKKWSPKLIFLDENFFQKNSVGFWHRKLTLKVQFLHFHDRIVLKQFPLILGQKSCNLGTTIF